LRRIRSSTSAPGASAPILRTRSADPFNLFAVHRDDDIACLGMRPHRRTPLLDLGNERALACISASADCRLTRSPVHSGRASFMG
jgi:hypothetical protein